VDTRLRRSREHLITAREEERLRIRRDLHDGLGPTLAGLSLQASSLKRLIATQPEAAQVGVDELRSELRKAISEVRGLVHDLRPPSLDQLGLKGALEQLAEGLERPDDQAPMRITTEITDLPTLPPATEVAIYRIVQEALTNTLKHAQARHATVTLKLECNLKLTLWTTASASPSTTAQESVCAL
jgi:signal transduction histidine kinase